MYVVEYNMRAEVDIPSSLFVVAIAIQWRKSYCIQNVGRGKSTQ